MPTKSTKKTPSKKAPVKKTVAKKPAAHKITPGKKMINLDLDPQKHLRRYDEYQEVLDAYLDEWHAKYDLIKAKIFKWEKELDMNYNIDKKRKAILKNIAELRTHANKMLEHKAEYLSKVEKLELEGAHKWEDIKKGAEKIMQDVKKVFEKVVKHF